MKIGIKSTNKSSYYWLLFLFIESRRKSVYFGDCRRKSDKVGESPKHILQMLYLCSTNRKKNQVSIKIAQL